MHTCVRHGAPRRRPAPPHPPAAPPSGPNTHAPPPLAAMLNLCRDEITNTLKHKVDSLFGSSFNTNGLGGVLTCGASGVAAGLRQGAREGGRRVGWVAHVPARGLSPLTKHGLAAGGAVLGIPKLLAALLMLWPFVACINIRCYPIPAGLQPRPGVPQLRKGALRLLLLPAHQVWSWRSPGAAGCRGWQWRRSGQEGGHVLPCCQGWSTRPKAPLLAVGA